MSDRDPPAESEATGGDGSPHPDDELRARRRLLKLGMYVAPAVITTLSIQPASAAVSAPSCGPDACGPTSCNPNRCGPVCSPSGGCAPSTCGPNRDG